MAKGTRSVDIVLEDGQQVATVIDVLSFHDELFLVLKGKREKPHVLRIRPSGLLVVPSQLEETVLSLHEREVERWATQAIAEPA